jgi:hypothetical protein
MEAEHLCLPGGCAQARLLSKPIQVDAELARLLANPSIKLAGAGEP